MLPNLHCSRPAPSTLAGRLNSDVEHHMLNPEWTIRGESVAQLINELRTFEDQEMEVRISIDGGVTSLPIRRLESSMGSSRHSITAKTPLRWLSTGNGVQPCIRAGLRQLRWLARSI